MAEQETDWGGKTKEEILAMIHQGYAANAHFRPDVSGVAKLFLALSTTNPQEAARLDDEWVKEAVANSRQLDGELDVVLAALAEMVLAYATPVLKRGRLRAGGKARVANAARAVLKQYGRLE